MFWLNFLSNTKNIVVVSSHPYELFPAFNCAKEISNLLSIWSGDSIFNPYRSSFLLFSADSPLFKSNIAVVSGCSSSFFYFALVLSALLSSNDVSGIKSSKLSNESASIFPETIFFPQMH